MGYRFANVWNFQLHLNEKNEEFHTWAGKVYCTDDFRQEHQVLS